MKCDKSLSPSKKGGWAGSSTNPVSPKINRRYAYQSDGFSGDEGNERAGRMTIQNNYGTSTNILGLSGSNPTSGITPYRVIRDKAGTSNNMFEETVFLRKDNND